MNLASATTLPFWNLLTGGLLTAELPSDGPVRDADLEFLRKAVLLSFSTLIGALFLFLFAAMNFVRENQVLGLADLITAVIVLGSYFHLRFSRNLLLISCISIVTSGVFFLFVLAHGDMNLATYVWTCVFPVIAVFLLGSGPGAYLAYFYLAVIIGFFIASPHLDGVTRYPLFIQIRILSVYFLIASSAIVMEIRRHKLFLALQTRRTELAGQIANLESVQREKKILIQRLQKSLTEVRTLKSFLPICSYCKKIRDDAGYWSMLEQYLGAHTDARVEMGLCPECTREGAK